jgi:hypothetical protein
VPARCGSDGPGTARPAGDAVFIEKKNNLGKMAAASGIGPLIGMPAGGRKGALIDAGVGAGGAMILVQFGANAPEIRLDPGSVLVLSVSPRKEESSK